MRVKYGGEKGLLNGLRPENQLRDAKLRSEFERVADEIFNAYSGSSEFYDVMGAAYESVAKKISAVMRDVRPASSAKLKQYKQK